MNASKRINPFFYHRLSNFEYKGNTKYFHPTFKLAFSYLASIQNKYDQIRIKPEALDVTLGLDKQYGPDGEFIIWWFLKVGILKEWEQPATLFRDSYRFYTLREIPAEQFTFNALASEVLP